MSLFVILKSKNKMYFQNARGITLGEIVAIGVMALVPFVQSVALMLMLVFFFNERSLCQCICFSCC